jgi:hypothetical protein
MFIPQVNIPQPRAEIKFSLLIANDNRSQAIRFVVRWGAGIMRL